MVRALAFAAAVAGLASPALAFQMPAPVSRPATKLQSDAGSAVAAPEYSQSVPFLLRPKKLEGMVGDVGFDPFGFSEYLDVKVLREGELKNGRVAMLAVVGFIVQQFVRLPGELYSEPNPVKAFYKVGPQPLLQIIIFCGVLEFILHKGKVTTLDMFSDPKREPGNFGFDPLGLGKDPAKRERYALSELKNGRLAMLAIGGLVHHALITGEGGF